MYELTQNKFIMPSYSNVDISKDTIDPSDVFFFFSPKPTPPDPPTFFIQLKLRPWTQQGASPDEIGPDQRRE